MSINKKIKELREKKRITQKELAERVNKSPQVISNWERSYTDPDYEDVSKLAEALECTADYLLGKSESPTYNENVDNKTKIINKISDEFPDADLMFNDLANMSAEQLEEVYDFIKFKLHKKED
ncbi:helix-turn-helix domain-containing protein [Salinibacillus xinjiangensis]|uniref:Helix-turn-helix domain-containing protein n=1 Tax=Salinibacillus xinjiangensis TaxID=1229268 RepID=A0A6G1X7R3_9BACI|nr:helix-turn-helix transcriptional regulator [Salinibacillus xinjiangensis]MRG86969.1 helix-turn-helix domain-containing protein [Salinibacillus xinjiangensis]